MSKVGATVTACLSGPVSDMLAVGSLSEGVVHAAAPLSGQTAKAGEEKTYECRYCHKTFGRLFILKRHEKMHSRGVSADPLLPTAGRRKKAKCACTNCQASKQACDDQDTCEFCQKRGLVCERVPKPVSTKRKTDDSKNQPLVPHPPAERPPKCQSVRRKQHAPTISTPMSLKADLAVQSLYGAGWTASQTPKSSDDGMDDFDMSEASTIRQMSESDTLTSATSDTLTLHEGYLSDDYDEASSPGMDVLIEEEVLLGADGMPYTGLTIRTTPDEDALVDMNLKSESGESLSDSPQTASPGAVFMMQDDEEMLDEFEEEEEAERLREQEQLLLIEQETMMRLSEQQRMNEQHQLQLLMIQSRANSVGFGR